VKICHISLFSGRFEGISPKADFALVTPFHDLASLRQSDLFSGRGSLSLNHGVWIVAVAVALAAGWTDLRSRRIPNWITVPALILGIALKSLASGWPGTRAALFGAALGFALLLPFALVRGIGMGDLKLVTAMGAFLGPHALITVLIFTIFLNGLIALGMIARQHRILQTLRNLGHMLGAFFSLHLPGSELTIDNPELVKVPFGVAFALAVVLYTAMRAWRVA
jgi:prepilin peptidase CpaA